MPTVRGVAASTNWWLANKAQGCNKILAASSKLQDPKPFCNSDYAPYNLCVHDDMYDRNVIDQFWAGASQKL